jgi:hypothetical protein
MDAARTIATSFHSCAFMRCLYVAGLSLRSRYIEARRSKLNSDSLGRISAAPEMTIESFDEHLFPADDWPPYVAPLAAAPARPAP